jgi:hypothetical protein
VPLLLGIAAATATLWVMEQRSIVNPAKERIKEELRNAAKPLIDALPSSGE